MGKIQTGSQSMLGSPFAKGPSLQPPQLGGFPLSIGAPPTLQLTGPVLQPPPALQGAPAAPWAPPQSQRNHTVVYDPRETQSGQVETKGPPVARKANRGSQPKALLGTPRPAGAVKRESSSPGLQEPAVPFKIAMSPSVDASNVSFGLASLARGQLEAINAEAYHHRGNLGDREVMDLAHNQRFWSQTAQAQAEQDLQARYRRNLELKERLQQGKAELEHLRMAAEVGERVAHERGRAENLFMQVQATHEDLDPMMRADYTS